MEELTQVLLLSRALAPLFPSPHRRVAPFNGVLRIAFFHGGQRMPPNRALLRPNEPHDLQGGHRGNQYHTHAFSLRQTYQTLILGVCWCRKHKRSLQVNAPMLSPPWKAPYKSFPMKSTPKSIAGTGITMYK